MTTTTAPAQAAVAVEERRSLRGWVDLAITPAFFVILGAALAVVLIYSDMDSTTRRILEPHSILTQLREHVLLTLWPTLLVVTIAVPLGIAMTRPKLRRFAPAVLGFANSGQAIPAYGLIILFLAWLGQGAFTAVVALTVFAILPVLRNTMVGLDQVDHAVIEAGRGMGLSKLQTLLGIELPLAVPVILAGIRTALVINVGMAALVYLIGAGGLGETIGSGLKLDRQVAVFVGAALVAMLALLIDWLAALAERFLRPKGI